MNVDNFINNKHYNISALCCVTSILPGGAAAGREPLGVDGHPVRVARPLLCPVRAPSLSICEIRRRLRRSEASLIRAPGGLSGLLLVVEVEAGRFAFLQLLLLQLLLHPPFVVGKCHRRHSSSLAFFLSFFGFTLDLNLEVVLD